MGNSMRQYRVAFILILIVLSGACLGYAFYEYPYWNRAPFYLPVDSQEKLTIRADSYGSGKFGAKRSAGRKHRGIDLLAKLGSPVYAVRSGRVIKAARHPGYGNFVIITHREGYQSLYAHLEKIEIEGGKRVRQGEMIGHVGKTGNAHRKAIQPHLHFEWIQNGWPVDPTDLLNTIDTRDERRSAIDEGR